MAGRLVQSVQCSVEGSALIVFEDETSAQSSSLLIQSALLNAFLLKVPVEVELVGKTSTIQRVLPFPAVTQVEVQTPAAGEAVISRVATQRQASGADEHLEAFISVNGGDEKAYNVHDPSLQQCVLAAFGLGRVSKKFTLEFDAAVDELVSMTLSRPSQ